MSADVLTDYRQLALELLRRELGPFVADVTVREDFDHDDQPALFFEAVLDASAPADLGMDFVFSHLHLREALEKTGETRFPYLRTRRSTTLGLPGDMILKTPSGTGSSVRKRRS